VADVVKASDEDLRWLYPDDDPSGIATRWLSGRPGLVLVTSGGKGATAYRAGHEPLHRPAPTRDVVDTVGAGDAWMGGILTGLHARGCFTGASIRALSRGQVADLLDAASLVASLACGRRGADPPTADEVDRARRANRARPASRSRAPIGDANRTEQSVVRRQPAVGASGLSTRP
jgi:fructokinase